MRYVVLLDGTALDMFDDESIVLTKQVKNLQNVASIQSDYTQSFQVPATKRNNKAFSHYYNVDIVNGFNAHSKTNATIEIDGLQIFNGVLELLSVEFKEGQPHSYSVVFYGDNKKLSTSMGEDTLQDVQYDDFNHTRSSQNITNSWLGNLLSGKVMYPVIAWGEAFNYSSTATNVTKNIATSAGTVNVDDLKPALLLKELVSACFSHYGYDSQGSFYDSDHLDDLYVAPSAYAGTLNVTQIKSIFEVRKYSQFSFPSSGYYWQMTYTDEVKDFANAMNYTAGTFTAPSAGTYDFTNKYTIVARQNGTINSGLFVNGTLSQTGSSHTTNGAKTESFQVTLSANDVVTMRYNSTQSGAILSDFNWQCTDSPQSSSNTSINFSELMPKIKVADFINGVLRTFNAVLIPKSDSRIDIEVVPTWYANGASKDWTKYVDLTSVTHKKVSIAKYLDFRHKQTGDFVNTAYEANSHRAFGSSSSTTSVDFGQDELKVQSIFNVFPPSYLHDINQYGASQGATDIQLYQALDETMNKVQIDLLLFYYNGLKSSDTWYFGGSSKTTFPIISPFNAYPTTSTSRSIAYSLESSLSGNAPEKTLMSEFWLEYLSRIYSSQSRLVEITLRLPVGQWLNLNLDETINVMGHYYKIDSITYDMLKQEARVTLMTYPDVNIWSASSTNNSWNVSIPASNPNGITFVGTGSQANVLGNITTISGSTTTDQPNATELPFIVVSNVIAGAYESESSIEDNDPPPAT